MPAREQDRGRHGELPGGSKPSFLLRHHFGHVRRTVRTAHGRVVRVCHLFVPGVLCLKKALAKSSSTIPA